MKKVFCRTLNFGKKIGKDPLYQPPALESPPSPTKVLKDASTSTSLDPMEIIIVKKSEVFDLLDDDGFGEDETSSLPLSNDSSTDASDFSEEEIDEEETETSLSHEKKRSKSPDSESATLLASSMTDDDFCCSDLLLLQGEELQPDTEETVQGMQKNDKEKTEVEKSEPDVVEADEINDKKELENADLEENAPKIVKIQKSSRKDIKIVEETSLTESTEASSTEKDQEKLMPHEPEIPNSLSALKKISEKLSLEETSNESQRSSFNNPQFQKPKRLKNFRKNSTSMSSPPKTPQKSPGNLESWLNLFPLSIQSTPATIKNERPRLLSFPNTRQSILLFAEWNQLPALFR
ncbi:Oidioi.mRNA.OKI2018_I69.PAR.g9757.t1.cds [Oikopleura dioica]|uniref:Oidioi.mRNA.OKI2018_I69.PAR.g9757.t1.cds n=1 Tax=Oikopleura dioica TaxID=34765 RepID=A0ABN7RM46_OIKDI|nr:Oidioi.mRNA.OKI2018_I69.PAR.g9757.t1.cds [Oikopleura dioica]